MRLQWVRVERRLNWPLWATGVLLLWLGLVIACATIQEVTGRHESLCLFKRLTGWPCPTCGAARGVLTAIHGDLLGAWLFNPLLFSVLIFAAALMLVRLLTGRALRLNLTKAEVRITWIIALAAVLVNWAYLIRYVE